MSSPLTIPVMWSAPPEPPIDADYADYDLAFVPTAAAQRVARLEQACRRAMDATKAVGAWEVVAHLLVGLEG